MLRSRSSGCHRTSWHALPIWGNEVPNKAMRIAHPRAHAGLCKGRWPDSSNDSFAIHFVQLSVCLRQHFESPRSMGSSTTVDQGGCGAHHSGGVFSRAAFWIQNILTAHWVSWLDGSSGASWSMPAVVFWKKIESDLSGKNFQAHYQNRSGHTENPTRN